LVEAQKRGGVVEELEGKKKTRFLAVNLFSVADFYDIHDRLAVINRVYNPIITFSNPIAVEMA